MAIGPNTFIVVGALALGGLVLYLNLWRAVLCVAPASLIIDADAPADGMTVPDELSGLHKELLSLGFVPVGSHIEKPRLTFETVSYDFANPAERAFATLYLSRRGEPRLYFLTQTEGGAFAITADHRRPSTEKPGRYLSGWLEERSLGRLFKAHQRRAATLGTAAGRFDQVGRLEAAKSWFAGPGRGEVRAQNLHGLLWSVGTLGMVGAAIFGKS
ncbi:MAG: hypothetical protein ACYC8T_18665 [Myxococcaceae bacterium]